MTEDKRRRVVEDALARGVKVTLNGKPAVIKGFKLDFAQISEIGDHPVVEEWAWETVHRVLFRTKNPGAFGE